MICFAGLTLVLLIALAIWSAQPDYVLAFGGLSQEDAVAVIGQLRDDKIQYRYEPSRGSIYVPATQVENANINIASKGLIHSPMTDTSLEDFAKNTWGQTEFVQKVKLKGILQNRLAGTIRCLDGVEAAKVTITEAPEETLFKPETQQAKASVIVTMRSNRSLTGEQVRTIGNLVSSSVPKLNPQQVQISDSTGRVYTHLSDEEGGGGLGMADEQLDATKRIENHFGEKIQSLLDTAVGPNLAAVRVSAQLSFDKTERKMTKFNPENKVLLREETISDNTQGGTLTPSGVPGVKPNIGEGSAAGMAKVENSATRKRGSREFSYDQTQEEVKTAMGTIKTLSVAVLISPAKDEKGVLKPLSESSRTKLKNIVEKTVAAVPNAKVTVEYLEDAFASAVPLGVAAAGPSFFADWVDLLKSHMSDIFAIVGILIMVLALRRVFAKAYMPAPRAPEPALPHFSQQPAATASTVGTVGQKQVPSVVMQENLRRLITQNNAQAVNIIRSMLK
jgi:flagellar M-ring protein FliF